VLSAGVRGGLPEHAGRLFAGDVLLRVGEADVTAANWLAALNKFAAGRRVPVVVRRGGETIGLALTLPAEPERVTYRIEKDESAPPQARAIRDAWLNGPK
jgi:S1-C subfamily serine protease